ncbi:MAG: MFS transporter [Bradyrhizobiaceae bacterium]|nr:MFS transporter [Bradyrhizobiaceae bacterium]
MSPVVNTSPQNGTRLEPESAYAWLRLATSLLLGTVGSVGMWSVVVALPAVQADFGVARADASLPFTLAMLGFGFGGIALGRLSDRFGIIVPVVIGAVLLLAGYLAAAFSPNLWTFALAHIVIGLASSATFGPMLADISYWFTARRGIAVAIAASGNYLAGTVWPPIVQYFIATSGWRPTHIGIGIFCVLAMLPLVLVLRRPRPVQEVVPSGTFAVGSKGAQLGISPNTLHVLLSIAGVACCVAMSMPQVHIVAYCGDLGYGAARGAEMLSLMLGLGIISRIASGFVADRIGGVATLLLGSTLQGVALFLYLWFDGLTSLYVISGLFGLFQGGIVPMYAIIVREYFPPQEAGTRLGVILLATLIGMAMGGWMSGLIFDLTGSYQAAFANGLVWNLINVSIATWLLLRSQRQLAQA